MTRYNPDSSIDFTAYESDHADDVDRAMGQVEEFGAVSWPGKECGWEQRQEYVDRILGRK